MTSNKCLIFAGNCENVFLHGSPDSFLVTTNKTGDMTTTMCTSHYLPKLTAAIQKVTPIHNHFGFMFMQKFLTQAYPNVHFYLMAVVQTPTHHASPFFAIRFSQSQPYSWVDIVINHVHERHEHTKASMSLKAPLTTKNVSLDAKTGTTLSEIFSNSFVIYLEQFNSDRDNHLLDFKVDTNTGYWTFKFLLSALSPTCSVSMGKMQSIIITNHKKENLPVKVFWFLDMGSNGRFKKSSACNMTLKNTEVSFFEYSGESCVQIGERQPDRQQIILQVSNKWGCGFPKNSNCTLEVLACMKFTIRNMTDALTYIVFQFEYFSDECTQNMYSKYPEEFVGLLSWSQTKDWCTILVPGRLPSIKSKNEMIQLVNLMKIPSNALHQVWIIFLDLMVTTKVV